MVDINKSDKVYFPSEWITYKGLGGYHTWGKVLWGYVVQAKRSTAVIKVMNEAKFVNRRNIKTVPLSVIKKSKGEVQKELK